MAAAMQSDFAFINLSHPDELKDQNTMYHVRHKAMMHVARARRMRNPKKTKLELIFEVQESHYAPPDAIVLSRVGLETFDPFASCPFTFDAHASRLCSSCKFVRLIPSTQSSQHY